MVYISIYIILLLYRDSASVESTRSKGGSLTLAPIRLLPSYSVFSSAIPYVIRMLGGTDMYTYIHILLYVSRIARARMHTLKLRTVEKMPAIGAITS